jgi:hypothetical protein
MSRLSSDSRHIVRIQKAAGTQFHHDLRKAGGGEREAAFAATGHAEMADHLVADVPGTVHDDPPGERVVIARLQALEPDRMAMGSDIGSPGPIGSCRARVRAWLIREALQPAGMQRVGAAPVGDQMRARAALGDIHQVKSRHTRGQGEVRNGDEILEADAVVVSFQRGQRTMQQDWGYQAIDAAGGTRSRASEGRRVNQSRRGQAEEKTTGKCQDFRFPA